MEGPVYSKYSRILCAHNAHCSPLLVLIWVLLVCLVCCFEFLIIYYCFVLFLDRTWLCSTNWPQMLDLSTTVSRILGLQVCITMPNTVNNLLRTWPNIKSIFHTFIL